jgi:dihydrofolate reductase
MVFNNLSLDGYIADENGDMSWAHTMDLEWAAFTSENAGGQAEMLFGRRTYELMAGFWPTPQALSAMPDVAQAKNAGGRSSSRGPSRSRPGRTPAS